MSLIKLRIRNRYQYISYFVYPLPNIILKKLFKFEIVLQIIQCFLFYFQSQEYEEKIPVPETEEHRHCDWR